MKKFFKEFGEFINRGNVVDLAIAVIMGSAFGKIISSFVEDIITPLIGGLVGGINIADLSVQIGESTIRYGSFLQNIIDFLIIAFVIFVVIRILNRMQNRVQNMLHKNEEKVPEEPVPEDIQLLREMRDLLKSRNYFK